MKKKISNLFIYFILFNFILAANFTVKKKINILGENRYKKIFLDDEVYKYSKNNLNDLRILNSKNLPPVLALFHMFYHFINIRICINWIQMCILICIVKYSKDLVGKGLPYLFYTFEIQNHFLKLFEICN